MPSERVQRQIEALLDQAEAAASTRDWQAVIETASAVLGFDQANEDANAFVNMARPALAEVSGNTQPPSAGLPAESSEAENTPAPSPSEPESFAGGRYHVQRFLGEGGKKRVFLAHDALLDRDVAFSLIKTDGLDEVGRERIMREAQAMGRLSHQNIVAIYDIGEHTTADGSKQPFLVQELMGGGDVEDRD
ncbi:MAG: hypothetical protein O3A10_09790 [Chloroflexi bacterium]|nr:hypothetical protein [Chloroflexota bacterium]MDA1147969.1 hypothetical protein [Chloroflexota bacterium]